VVMLAPLQSGFAYQDEPDPQWTQRHADLLGQPDGADAPTPWLATPNHPASWGVRDLRPGEGSSG
jgi:hypothetical protein